jgi:hypothetical protein
MPRIATPERGLPRLELRLLLAVALARLLLHLLTNGQTASTATNWRCSTTPATWRGGTSPIRR